MEENVAFEGDDKAEEVVESSFEEKVAAVSGVSAMRLIIMGSVCGTYTWNRASIID